MAPPTIEESIERMMNSISSLDKLQFSNRSSRRVAAAVLQPPEVFEGAWIREAEEHERGLFQTAPQTAEHARSAGDAAGASGAIIDKDRLRRSIMSRSTANGGPYREHSDRSGPSWTLQKRAGPQRLPKPPTATPLRKRRPQHSNARGDSFEDPEPYILAAKKLLEQYAGTGNDMVRAREHVDLLHSQYEGLMESIADLEEDLAKQSQHQPALIDTDEEDEQAEIEALKAEIRREELEILALKELKAERDKKLREAQAAAEASKPLGRTATARPRQAGLTNTSQTIGSSSKKAPSALALKMAEARQRMKAQASSSETPKAASRPASSAIAPAARSPEVRMGELTENKDAAAGVASIGESSPTAQPAPPRPAIEPLVPAEQLQALVTKIASALPSASSTDAQTLLRQLQSAASTGSEPATTPVQTMEYCLLADFLTLILALPLDNTSLTVAMRPVSGKSSPEPMIALNALKAHLGAFAKEQGWAEDLGTKAVYGLVAKRIIKIDRSGRESFVAFI